LSPEANSSGLGREIKYVREKGDMMEFTIKFEIAASDVERARSCYSSILGLEPVNADEDEELLYRAGGAQFGIYESENAGTNKATTMRFVVSDFNAVRAELLDKGVGFEDYDLGDDFRTVDGVLTSPDGEKTSWFKDSEGNILALGSSL
jgi:catechol 2,3-dioxygenase-like lactoylglutathione lyase family enzyme